MDETAIRVGVDVGTICLQIVVAVGAIWLARETSGLRKSTADLFRATQEAAIAQTRPFLHVGLAERTDTGAAPDRWKYVCLLENLTQALARRVQAFVFDREIQKYRKNRAGHAYIAAETSRRVSIDLMPYSFEEALSDLTLSPRERELLVGWLQPRPRSFILCSYRDINGRLYCTSREFSYGSTGRLKYEHELQHFGDDLGALSV